jgi:titin
VTSWEPRAGTGNGAYQLYLFVNEGAIDSSGNGSTRFDWELGLIKVASSGGFASSQSNCPYDVWVAGGHWNASGAFAFGANDAIGTRRAIASSSVWTAHDSAGSGTLNFWVSCSITSGVSIGSPSIGQTWYTATPTTRTGTAPANPIVASRDSDTQVTLTAYNSGDWGTGTGGVQHNLDKTDVSGWGSLLSSTSYPTTAGGAAHSVVQSGLTPFKTYYFRDAVLSRNGVWVASSGLTVYSRPNQPPAPEVASKTTTSLNLTTAAPTYAGAGITARETQLLAADGVTVLQTSTHLTAPSFTGLTRVTTYKTRTRATNSAGTSDWSDIATFTTPGTVPSAPTGYSVQNVASTSASVTTGSLSDNGGAVPSQIRVKVSTTNSDTGLIQTVTQPSWNDIAISGLTKGTNYWVAEAAYNTVEGGGWGAYGAYVPFTTLANVPNAPTLSLNSAGATNATLQWVAPTALNGAVITSYQLRVASNQALTQNVQDFTIPAGTLSQVVTGLIAATGYYAAIWTVNDTGVGSVSPVLSFSTTGGGGTTSGVWYSGSDGIPKFSEVWYSGSDGVPKLCEVWYSGADGIPKLCTS